MATITANITSSAEVIPTSAEVEIGYYTIDDEDIYVHGTSRGQDGRAFDRLFASVNRGVAGTTAASHTSGATLTRYYPDAATAGSNQTITLLGPFTVAADTAVGAGVFGDGGLYTDITPLPDGALIIAVWCEVTVGFNGTGVDEIFYAVGVPEDPTGNLATDLHVGSVVSSATDLTDPTHYTATAPSRLYVTSGVASVIQPARAVSGVTLQAYYAAGSAASAGSADIYALIAVPA